MCEEESIFSKFFNMFLWASGFQKSLAQTDFNLFVDEWTSSNERPAHMAYSDRTYVAMEPGPIICQTLHTATYVGT